MESRLFTESGNPCSLIYIGFSLTTKRPYIGMVEDRPPIARFNEHWKCTVNHRENNVDEVDWKYQFMAKTGAWDWYFLPLVVCTGTIAKARLRSLERTILLSYPNALNFEARRHFNKAHRPAISHPGVSRHVGQAMDFAHRPRSLRNRRVVTDIGFIDSMGRLQHTVDPATAFANSVVMLHSSFPWNLLTIRRQHRSSLVNLSSVDAGPMGLATALDLIIKQDLGWVIVTFITREPKELSRPEDYDYLLQILRHEVDRTEATDLLASDLWRMWGISAREIAPTAPKTHMKNTRFISRELRGKGFTLRPCDNVVVRLPASSSVTKKDVLQCLRSALVKTYLPLCVCDHFLHRLSIVWEAPQKLGAALDNGRRWAAEINECREIKCCCASFPGLPTRHGHVFCPSWEYTGLYQSTVRACMRSHVGVGDDWEAIQNGLRSAWLRYLPAWSLPHKLVVSSLGSVGGCDIKFRPDVVRKCAKHLGDLAVMAMDKQASALLLQ